MNNFFLSENEEYLRSEHFIQNTNSSAKDKPLYLSSIGFAQVYYFLEMVGTLDDLQGFSEKGRVLCILSPSIIIRASELKIWI